MARDNSRTHDIFKDQNFEDYSNYMDPFKTDISTESSDLSKLQKLILESLETTNQMFEDFNENGSDDYIYYTQRDTPMSSANSMEFPLDSSELSTPDSSQSSFSLKMDYNQQSKGLSVPSPEDSWFNDEDSETSFQIFQESLLHVTTSPLKSEADVQTVEIFDQKSGKGITNNHPDKLKKPKRTRRCKPPLVLNYDDMTKSFTTQLRENKEIWDQVTKKKKKGIYKCTHCSEFFPSIFCLAQHFDEFKIARYHKCPFEGCVWHILGLPRKAEVRRHCASQHSAKIEFIGAANQVSATPAATKIDSLRCYHEQCSKVFKRKDSLQRHLKLVHLNQKSRFNKRLRKSSQTKPPNCGDIKTIESADAAGEVTDHFLDLISPTDDPILANRT